MLRQLLGELLNRLLKKFIHSIRIAKLKTGNLLHLYNCVNCYRLTSILKSFVGSKHLFNAVFISNP